MHQLHVFNKSLPTHAGDEYGPIVVYPLYSSLPPRQQQDIFKDAPPPRQPGGPPGEQLHGHPYEVEATGIMAKRN